MDDNKKKKVQDSKGCNLFLSAVRFSLFHAAQNWHKKGA